ncbi:MAG TPA: ABC transporter ATP-binding protein [Candidatus Binataceae bacterium]|nr:ABC transporter ATP-binding protein [Candidatus Binataceae bacterium]
MDSRIDHVRAASEPLIEAVGLQKSLGARSVLVDVTLTVAAGEIVGLLGPNGAGKTTTLSILATLLPPEAGTVRIAGLNIAEPGVRLGALLGYVPQSLALYPSLNSRQNVHLFARASGLSSRGAMMGTERALEAVGLGDRANDQVWTLSGGMKRRLNLACAIAHRPRVLLLDEPTVGVDPQSRESIFRLVRKLADEGVGILYSTHYMEEVERMCDRAVLIDRGKVVADGTVQQIITMGGHRPRIAISLNVLPHAGWCNRIPDVRELGRDRETNLLTVEFSNYSAIEQLLETIKLSGCRPVSFTVHSPNLSDAFMALTGRALRDDSGLPLEA